MQIEEPPQDRPSEKTAVLRGRFFAQMRTAVLRTEAPETGGGRRCRHTTAGAYFDRVLVCAGTS